VFSDLTRAAERAVAFVRAKAGLTGSASTTTEPVPKTPPRRSGRAVADAQTNQAGPTAEDAVLQPLETSPAPTIVAPPMHLVQEHAAVAESIDASDDRVYSIGDDDVDPPALRAATMVERWHAAGAAETVTIEVVVAKDGAVEKVQLLSRVELADMMMLSSVKTWQFEPAYRAGVPVRYRLVLAYGRNE
jgi:hypothetical protein